MMAGYNGGYGLFVKLAHTREIGTGYGHMSRLGPGIKPGVMVRQGQVIGFVGSTGMSTGPHLHYEFYRGGRAVNPLAQKFAMQASLGGKDLARFKGLAGQYVAQLKNAPKVAKPDAIDDNRSTKVDAGKRETAKEGRQPNVAARSRLAPKKHDDAIAASQPATADAKPAVKHTSKMTASKRETAKKTVQTQKKKAVASKPREPKASRARQLADSN
jgi:hypothetical protein